jgi:CheY-like chemotaxis protein
MMLDLEPVQVSSLFETSLSVIREKAAARGLRVAVDTAADLGSIQVDARKVKQIVYNLLSNAVKFTPDGGAVTLRASRVPRATVGQALGAASGWSFPLADSAFDEFLSISITDTGIGMTSDALSRLFQPFSQIDSGLARKFEGTGLGLAMVKLLAELHGGTVAVQSSVGVGSAFTVWLPLRAAHETPAGTDKPGAPGLGAVVADRTALVIEHDLKSAELIRMQLEAEGFHVVQAASADEALAIARRQPLALITLDIMLPGADGWEFLSRIKRLPELRRIPVVIVSIVADPARGFSLGAAAVMQKPMSRQQLYDALVDIGLFPLPRGRMLKVLVVDDDRAAVELVAVRLLDVAGTVLRAYGGREGIEMALAEQPDVIILDLLMPGVSGFDVVAALNERRDAARIPILIVTAKEITPEDRARLTGVVTAIMEKAGLDADRFTTEVRRAMSGRWLAA